MTIDVQEHIRIGLVSFNWSHISWTVNSASTSTRIHHPEYMANQQQNLAAVDYGIVNVLLFHYIIADLMIRFEITAHQQTL